MGKTSFKSLAQISKFISEQINQLNNGQLNNSELVDLTQNAQELYERLIVLRHKSYEAFGESEVIETTEIKTDTPILAEENIKEVEPSVEDMLEEVSPMMSFDFSEPITQTEPEKMEVLDTEIEKEINEDVNEPIIKETMSQHTASLNDSFKSSESLADKLTKSKVESLKSAIGINEKFAFISNLFAGSNENYNEAINRLDNSINAEDAKMILNELSIDNNWDLEDSTTSSLINLVERKFN